MNITSVSNSQVQYSKISLDYKSASGDKFHLEAQTLEIKNSETVINKNQDGDAYLAVDGGAKNAGNLKTGINQMLWDYKEALIKSFVEMHGGKYQKISPDGLVDKSGKQVSLEEYWNADNTSQRIVDFALAFAPAHGDDPEFMNKIKAAIKKGFDQALGSMGKLPEQTQSLVNDTYKQIIKKLDDYEQGHKNGGGTKNAGDLSA